MPYYNDNEDTEFNFQSLIDVALVKYCQDVLNKANFAIASRGANPIVSLTSFTWACIPLWIQVLLRPVGLSSFNSSSEMALASDNHVGKCWRMHGDTGTLGISLNKKVNVKGIVIEFPLKGVLADIEDYTDLYRVRVHGEPTS